MTLPYSVCVVKELVDTPGDLPFDGGDGVYHPLQIRVLRMDRKAAAQIVPGFQQLPPGLAVWGNTVCHILHPRHGIFRDPLADDGFINCFKITHIIIPLRSMVYLVYLINIAASIKKVYLVYKVII